MTLTEQPLGQFLEAVASRRATPGGGSVAALMGALGAALLCMVARLTVGKRGYEAVASEMEALLEKADLLKDQLEKAIEADVEAFNRVMDAYRLPEGEGRERALQEALRQATEVPLECARLAADVVILSQIAAEKGNRNLLSDAQMAALAAFAALKGSALNVQINAERLQDSAFAEEARRKVARLIEEARPQLEAICKRAR